MKLYHFAIALSLSVVLVCYAGAKPQEEKAAIKVAPQEGKTTIKVAFINLNDRKGLLCVQLFDKDKGFPLDRNSALVTKDVDLGKVSADTKLSEVEVSFDQIAAGRYALSVYVDKNSNGKLDRNFIGKPKEPVGVSTNFKPKMKLPGFTNCAFDVQSNTETKLSIIFR